MKSLLHDNPYLRQQSLRHQMIADSVRESSIFEGAKCFHVSSSRKRASTQSRKKAVSGV